MTYIVASQGKLVPDSVIRFFGKKDTIIGLPSIFLWPICLFGFISVCICLQIYLFP